MRRYGLWKFYTLLSSNNNNGVFFSEKMGGQQSTIGQRIIQNTAMTMQSKCDHTTNDNQEVYCPIYLGPGCDTNKIGCGNSLSVQWTCTSSQSANAINQALQKSGISEAGEEIGNWKASDSESSQIQSINMFLSQHCSDTENINQDVYGPLQCEYAHNNVVKIFNHADSNTACALTAISSAMQHSSQFNKSAQSGVNIGLIVGIILAIIVVVVILVVIMQVVPTLGKAPAPVSSAVPASAQQVEMVPMRSPAAAAAAAAGPPAAPAVTTPAVALPSAGSGGGAGGGSGVGAGGGGGGGGSAVTTGGTRHYRFNRARFF